MKQFVILLLTNKVQKTFFIYCFLEDLQSCLVERSPACHKIIKNVSFATVCHLKSSAAEGIAAQERT